MNASARSAAPPPRPDLRGFAGYRSARSESLDGEVWLNANESPWPSAADPRAALRRYPDPQPGALRAALAALYDCPPGSVLIGRGSDEAIDLLVRAYCRAGEDAVLVTPPVFGMYATCARIQGARVVEVPLREVAGAQGVDLVPDLDAVAAAALATGARLVFLCSPGNPAGPSIATAVIHGLAKALDGRALVVVDEAYGEYSGQPSAASLLPALGNLAVLRTLSKAHALAGARIGCVLADPAILGVLRACQAPYPVPAPCAALALAALEAGPREDTARRIASTLGERARLRERLAAIPGCRPFPAHANFVLARFADADAAFARLLADGIVVRDMRAFPRLGDALRIGVGTPDANERVVAALSGGRRAA